MFPYFDPNKKSKKNKCFLYRRKDGSEKELSLKVHRKFLLFRYFNDNIPESFSPLAPAIFSNRNMREIYKCVLYSYLSYKDRSIIDFPPEIQIEFERFDSDIGKIPFFIVFDSSINAIVVSCRGSSCMDDFITDSLGNGVSYDGGKFHEGVFSTASYIFMTCQTKLIELNEYYNKKINHEDDINESSDYSDQFEYYESDYDFEEDDDYEDDDHEFYLHNKKHLSYHMSHIEKKCHKSISEPNFHTYHESKLNSDMHHTNDSNKDHCSFSLVNEEASHLHHKDDSSKKQNENSNAKEKLHKNRRSSSLTNEKPHTHIHNSHSHSSHKLISDDESKENDSKSNEDSKSHSSSLTNEQSHHHIHLHHKNSLFDKQNIHGLDSDENHKLPLNEKEHYDIVENSDDNPNEKKHSHRNFFSFIKSHKNSHSNHQLISGDDHIDKSKDGETNENSKNHRCSSSLSNEKSHMDHNNEHNKDTNSKENSHKQHRSSSLANEKSHSHHKSHEKLYENKTEQYENSKSHRRSSSLTNEDTHSHHKSISNAKLNENSHSNLNHDLITLNDSTEKAKDNEQNENSKSHRRSSSLTNEGPQLNHKQNSNDEIDDTSDSHKATQSSLINENYHAHHHKSISDFKSHLNNKSSSKKECKDNDGSNSDDNNKSESDKNSENHCLESSKKHNKHHKSLSSIDEKSIHHHKSNRKLSSMEKFDDVQNDNGSQANKNSHKDRRSSSLSNEKTNDKHGKSSNLKLKEESDDHNQSSNESVQSHRRSSSTNEILQSNYSSSNLISYESSHQELSSNENSYKNHRFSSLENEKVHPHHKSTSNLNDHHKSHTHHKLISKDKDHNSNSNNHKSGLDENLTTSSFEFEDFHLLHKSTSNLKSQSHHHCKSKEDLINEKVHQQHRSSSQTHENHHNDNIESNENPHKSRRSSSLSNLNLHSHHKSNHKSETSDNTTTSHDFESSSNFMNKDGKKQIKIIITGHSLGAAVAGVVAYLFREKFPELNVHAICFAPPPTLTFNLWKTTGSYIKSFMIEGDIVPFLSVLNIIKLSDILFPTEHTNKAFKNFVESYLEKQSVEKFQEDVSLTETLYPPGQMYLIRFTNEKENGLFKKKRKRSDPKSDSIQLCQILNPDYFANFVKNIQEFNHVVKNYMRLIIRLMNKFKKLNHQNHE